jgi:UDP-glucose 4-epimerase
VKVLVTGGAGFIGSHLTERLLARGDSVVVLDDLSTGRRENLSGCDGHSALELRVGSVLDQPLVAELAAGCDAIVHLAAAVGVRLIVERPVHTIETNVHGTESVLRAAAPDGRRVLLASTSEVYGKSSRLPFREDDDLALGPTSHSRWAYACSKALDELLALAYWREKRVPTTICRFFNTVGPRQTGRYGMVLPRFVSQALAGDPITVYGDGRQTRCFGHVADAVEAVLRLLDSEAAVGAVFNVGNDEEISIGELAERVRAATGSASQIVHVPYSEAYGEGFEDMQRRVPDCSRLAAVTGFKPRIPLEAILADVIAERRPGVAAP